MNKQRAPLISEVEDVALIETWPALALALSAAAPRLRITTRARARVRARVALPASLTRPCRSTGGTLGASVHPLARPSTHSNPVGEATANMKPFHVIIKIIEKAVQLWGGGRLGGEGWGERRGARSEQ